MGIISYKHRRALFGSEKCKVFSISGTVGVSLQFSKWCIGVVELESSLMCVKSAYWQAQALFKLCNS